MKRAFIMVLDSFGIGATEDAERFGDVGSDTLGHIAEACAKGEADNGRKGPLNLPNLTRLGLVKAHEGSTGKIAAGMDGNAEVVGAYAWAHELSSGKDTPSGHWEIAGVPVLFDWGYFSDHENSFPQELLEERVRAAFAFPAPVKQVEPDVGCLELFHGPTLAFKDFGGRFMAQMLTHISGDKPDRKSVV